MSTQLDILALEPFYGGIRRGMLETLSRYSRHRWTILKLPPRRIERRLTAAAHWFAEQLSRHWSGKVDLLFTSEVLNLADLYRLVPFLSRKPSVVYFHDNELPDPGAEAETPIDLVNLNTAAAATEIWFNSLYHWGEFLRRANALVDRHNELKSRDPIPDLTRKALLMPPPVDTGILHEIQNGEKIAREKHTIFVDTRDADAYLLSQALGIFQRRGERFNLVTVGPVDELSPDLPRRTIAENDTPSQIRALYQASTIISARPSAVTDLHVIRALSAGCWPVLPESGFYPELLPKKMHSSCLYEVAPDMLASRLQDVWHLERPDGYQPDLAKALMQYDPAAACKAIDERLEDLIAPQTNGK